jgi:hypothetical protein
MTENLIIKDSLQYGPTLLMLGIFLYDRIRKPEVKLEANTQKLKDEMLAVQTTCVLRHKTLDTDIAEIKKVLNNHLHDFSSDMTEMKGSIIRIETRLDEKDKAL